MESTASLRLPIQSPPVSRGIPGRQGHRHPGGIETAACPFPVEYGACEFADRTSVGGASCNYCCSPSIGGVHWVSDDSDADVWCPYIPATTPSTPAAAEIPLKAR